MSLGRLEIYACQEIGKEVYSAWICIMVQFIGTFICPPYTSVYVYSVWHAEYHHESESSG
jgi:hypothetical protein